MIFSASLVLVILTVRLVRRRLECDEEGWREEPEEDDEDGGELPPPPPPPLGTSPGTLSPGLSGKGGCPGGGPLGLGGGSLCMGGSPLGSSDGAEGLPETGYVATSCGGKLGRGRGPSQ